MNITWSGYRGENRALHPLNLPEGQCAASLNQNPVRGDFRPWRFPLTVSSLVSAPANQKTIYRMGRDLASDTNYWLSWPGIVHAVRGLVAEDTTERTYYTGDGVPKWTDNIKALTTTPYPAAFRLLGVPAPASAPTVTTFNDGSSPQTQSRYYVYTYVTDAGEESAPSPVSLELVCKTDDLVAVSNLVPPPFGAYGINRIRVYRTQSGAAGETEFFFLREVASTEVGVTDDKRALGEVLPSGTWLVPPTDLRSLTGMWNGMMAGISGNSVRFCEAYKPYAWPLAYEVITTDSKPVTMKVFGQSLLVLTTGRPRLITGSSPDALDDQPVELTEACVSERSAVSFGHGVAWACPDGLIYFGAGGAKMITDGLMTREDWQAINPTSIIGSMYEGSYLGSYTVGAVTKGFLVNPLSPSGIFFFDIVAAAFFFDEVQDQLYLADNNQIKKWDAGTFMTATARSKIYRSPKPINFGCFQITADAYPVSFKLDAVSLAPGEAARLVTSNPLFTSPTPTSVRYSVSVTSGAAQRLPSGMLAEQWQMEAATTGAVQGVALAQSIKELAQL